jgi:hypothetical protein
MAWTTTAALLEWTADVLKVDEADLPALWTRNAAAAVQSAYEDLLAVLGNTSYSGTQISTSDQAENWNLQQGLFALAGLGGGFGDYKSEFFDRFNVVAQLAESLKSGGFSLTSAGVPIAPDGTSAVGGIRYGNGSGISAAQAQCRFWGSDRAGYYRNANRGCC